MKIQYNPTDVHRASPAGQNKNLISPETVKRSDKLTIARVFLFSSYFDCKKFTAEGIRFLDT